MQWVVWVALAAAGWVSALVIGVTIASRARRGALSRAVRLRTHLRPYLRRRAAEVGVEIDEAPSVSAEAIVGELCDLADRLNEVERGEIAHGDTASMAVSDTMPLSVDTGPQQPK